MNPKTAILLCALVGWTSAAVAEVNVQQNADGSYYTGVFVNGSSSTKYDIVFIGDGFTESEQENFNWKVSQAVEALWNLEPYSDHMCAFNVWRVNVVSNDSGIDHPGQYPAIYRDTELDCTFGNPLDPVDPEPLRLIKSKSWWKCYEAAGHAPSWNAVFVLVNETLWGGTADGIVYSTIHPDFYEIITHELGHKIGGLADEYPYYLSKNDTPSAYTGGEPYEPNVTTKTEYAEIKWNDLIYPSTPLPTTLANTGNKPHLVGIWEGAYYHAYDVYRPQYACQMRDSLDPFCIVCERRLVGTLENYETEPPNMVCSGALRELLAMARMPWEEVQSRFLLPWCLTCPPRVADYDNVIYVLNGLPDGFEINITDETGQVVAEGVQTQDGLMVGFNAEPSGQYFVNVIGNGVPTGELLNMNSQLLINGEEQALPQ